MVRLDSFLEKVSEDLESYVVEERDSMYADDLVVLKAFWDRKKKEILVKIDESWNRDVSDVMENPYNG